MKAQICFALTILFTTVSYAQQWQGTDPITFIPPGIGGTSNGSTVTTGVLISCNGSGTSLNLGVDASIPQYSWIQSRSRASDIMMNLGINPWGGKVGIGTTGVPATKLEVNGTISMVRGNRLQFLEVVGGANRAFIEGDLSNQLLFHVGSGSGTDAMLINSSGAIGIGTNIPATKLEVNGSISMARGNRLQFLEGVGGANRAFIEGDANNQLLFHVGSGSGLDAMLINPLGSIGIGTNTPVAKLHINTATWASSLLTFSDTHYSPAKVYHFQIESDGLKIKQDNSINYLFKSGGDFIVNNGTVHSKEVKVSLTPGQGPDYVFEKDYNLLPLSEVEAYVNQNKHLPEVPSATEMEENGLNLKEMNLLLLKKVEELTLHLIEMNKLVVEQNNKINEQNQLILRQNERLAELEKTN